MLLALLGVATSAAAQAPAIGSVSGTWSDGSTVTITGSGFGAKAHGAPSMWDDADHGLTLSARGWNNYTPTTCSGVQNIGYRTPTDVGRGVGLPHSHVQHYIAGDACDGTLNTSWKMDLGKNRNIAALPAYTYWTYWYRHDPNWQFTTNLPNHKDWVWSWGEAWAGFDGSSYCYADHGAGPTDPTTNYGSWGDNNDGCGWNGGSTRYWGQQSSTSAYLAWHKVEIAVTHSRGTDGLIQIWDNGQLVINNAAANVASKVTIPFNGANETWTNYDRVTGPNQWSYITDVYVDDTLQRALVCEGSTWGTRGRCEPQIPSAWADGSITVKVNEGLFTDNGTGYLYVVNPAGTASAPYTVTFRSGNGAAICGNGVVETGEVCDDGNTVTETACPYGTPTCTACNATCSATLNLTGPYCGDGVINGTEKCDGAQLGGATCQSQGFTGGTLSCSATCTYNTAQCTGGSWQNPEAVCSDSHTLFCNQFEEGTAVPSANGCGGSAPYDDYDCNPASTNAVSLDPGPLNHTGNHIEQLHPPTGAGGQADLVKVLPTPADKVYARWYQKWDPSFNFADAQHGSGLFGGARSLLGRSGIKPNGSDMYQLLLQSNPLNSKPELYVYYPGMHQDCSNPNGSCWGDRFPCYLVNGSGYCPSGQAENEKGGEPTLTQNRWYCFEVMVDPGTPTSGTAGANGVLDFWVDGQEIGPWNGLWFRNTAALQTTIHWMQLYYNNAHTDSSFYLDNLVVSTQRIGCLSGGSLCGNGVVDPGEQCDGGVGANTCSSVMGPTYSGTLSCASNCTWNTSGCTTTPPIAPSNVSIVPKKP